MRSESITEEIQPESKNTGCLIGDKLVKIRNYHGLSQETFSKIIGYTLNMYRAYEKNKTMIRYDSLKVIISKLNVDPHWLFSVTDEQKKNFVDYEKTRS